MSFKDIRIAALARVSSLLVGEGYKELDDVFNPENNPENLLDKGYGVLWGSGRSVPDITRKITTSGIITVILAYGLPVRPDDDIKTVIDDVYADIDTLVGSFFNATLLEIPSTLLAVDSYSLSNPKIYDSKKHVEIRIDFNVRFRTNINY